MRSYRLVRDQHVGDAALNHRFGFAHFLAAHADRAGRDLPLGDLRALVRLGVGAHAHPVGYRVVQGLEVLLEGVEIEDQRRGIDLLDALAYRSRRTLGHTTAAFRARSCSANQTMAAATSATSGSAMRFTRSQPAVVTVMPEAKDEMAIMMKMAWSFAP